jgi:ribosomal protein S18 acetylase RimI-like enzyme
MPVQRTTDRDRIERVLRRHELVHVYAIADLDDDYFDHSRWWLLTDRGRDVAIGFVIDNFEPPLLYAIDPEHQGYDETLLTSIVDDLPDVMFANVMPDAAACLSQYFWFDDGGLYTKMALHTSPTATTVRPHAESFPLVRLTLDDLDELHDVFEDTPDSGRLFVPDMLASGLYVGVRIGGELASIAGTHVLSPTRRVAAVGNVVTRAEYRNRGLASACSAEIMRLLAPDVDTVGLNVAHDRTGARAIYGRLGFGPVLDYREGTFTRRA